MIHSYLVCVRKGALSQQALGKALKINPQVSNLRTVQNSVTDPCQTKRPKHRRQNTFRRPPSKKPSESTSSLWAVLETKNVRLFVRLSWTWMQTNLHCTTAKMKCKNKSHCLFTFSLLTTKKQSRCFHCLSWQLSLCPWPDCDLSRRVRPVHFVHGSVTQALPTLQVQPCWLQQYYCTVSSPHELRFVLVPMRFACKAWPRLDCRHWKHGTSCINIKKKRKHFHGQDKELQGRRSRRVVV